MQELDTEVARKNENLFEGYPSIVANSTDADFKPFSFSGNIETEKEPAFEVEKQYNFDRESYGMVEEQSKSMEFITLDKQSETEKVPQIVAESYSKPRLNARGKIIACVYSIIVAIIIAFSIYNAVAINGLNSEIVAKNEIVATQTAVINEYIEEYNSLGEDQVILEKVGSTYKPISEADITRVDEYVMCERQEPEVQSNWFERFCQKLRNLFS